MILPPLLFTKLDPLPHSYLKEKEASISSISEKASELFPSSEVIQPHEKEIDDLKNRVNAGMD